MREGTHEDAIPRGEPVKNGRSLDAGMYDSEGVCSQNSFRRTEAHHVLGAICFSKRCPKRYNFETEIRMGMTRMQAVALLIGLVAASGAAAQEQPSTAGQAQTNPARRAQAVDASDSQFDLGASFFESFNTSTSGLGTSQNVKDSVGGMFEARYIRSTFIGGEFTYSYSNSATQTFTPKSGACGFTCANPATKLSAKASEIGLDYVASKKFGNLRPFAVGGIGFFITSPANSTYEVTTVVRPAIIYGGGADWSFSPHFGIRAQFRDNLYKAPNLSALYPATGVYMHSSEPMGGVFYKF